MILRDEVKNQFILKTRYDDNMNKAHIPILGQCTKVLKNKLQTIRDKESDIKNQTIGILKEIK